MLPGLTLSACTLRLQEEKEGKSARMLSHVCEMLFASSSQLQLLSLSMHYQPISRHRLVNLLPRKLISLMKLLPSLESLAFAIPHDFDLSALERTVPSLQKLKVHLALVTA